MNIYEWEMAHPEPKAPDHRAFNNYAGVLPGMSADESSRYLRAYLTHRVRLDDWRAERAAALTEDSREANRADWSDWIACVVFLGIPYGSMIALIVLAIMGRL